MALSQSLLKPPEYAACEGARVHVWAATADAHALAHTLEQAVTGSRVSAFDSFAETLRETLEAGPDVWLVDMDRLTPAIIEGLTRFRIDPSGAGTRLLVRAGRLNDAEQIALLTAGIDDLHLGPRNTGGLGQAVVALFEGDEHTPARLAERLKSLEHSLPVRHDLFPAPSELDRIRRRYGLDIDLQTHSMGSNGGDLCGFLDIDADRFAVFLADFSGHGISVALHAQRLKDLMGGGGFDLTDPSAVLGWVNRRLNAVLPFGKFAAMIYAVIDLKAGRLAYAVSAMGSQMLRENAEVDFNLLQGSGLPLGYVRDASFDTRHAAFGAGAELILFSDSLTETPLPPDARFDEDSLCGFLNDLPRDLPVRVLNHTLIDALGVQRDQLQDDLTLLCIRKI